MDSQFEIALRHEFAVNRLAASIVAGTVNPAYSALSKKMLRLLDGYSGDMSTKELNALRAEIKALIVESMGTAWAAITQELNDFAAYEADYQSKTIAGLAVVLVAAIDKDRLEKKINATPLVLHSGSRTDFGLLTEYVNGHRDAVIRVVDAEIRTARDEAMPREALVKKLVGTKKAGYTDGIVSDKTRRWAENLTRTGMSHYANAARAVAHETYGDEVEGKIFSNVFDNRTTPYCLHHGQEAMGGKVYQLNDPNAPRIPGHHGCRSLWLIKIYGVNPFAGTRASVGGQKGKDAAEEYAARKTKLDATRDKRAELRAEGKETPETPSKVRYKGKKDADMFDPKQIPANVSPQQFFESQPDWWLESSLGKTRAKLFREGGLPIEKFTDEMGRKLTLKEMRELDSYDRYFVKAGLSK